MNKGCIIGLVVFAIIAVLGIVAVVFFGKKALGVGQASALFVVEEAIKGYKAAKPNEVPAENTNEAWAAVLKGTDFDNIQAGGQSLKLEIDQFIHNGKMTDLFGKNAIELTAGADGSISAVLPGPDGQVGTADDITSASFRNLIKMGQK